VKKDAAPRGPGRPSNDDKLAGKIAEMYGLAALGCMGLGKVDLSMRIAAGAEDLGAAWVKVANESPAVRKLLERLTTTSAIGSLVAAHFTVFGPELLALLPGARTQGEPEGEPEAPAPVSEAQTLP
jgi:hypothetical protein